MTIMPEREMGEAELITFPRIKDTRGNLSFLEFDSHIPFEIARTYWIYDVPGGESRGGHAYHTLSEVVIALSGSFEVIVDSGREKKRFTLNRSYYGLLVPRLLWRQIENFSTNSLCLIAASHPYDEGDYIRDYQIFKRLKGE